MVKVLVGKREGPKFPGFWAEFEGEEVASYEEPRPDKNITYTLYKCTAYNFDAYRVHVADESNPANPVYELHPNSPYQGVQGARSNYSEAWRAEDVVAQHPMFVKHLGTLDTIQVDPV